MYLNPTQQSGNGDRSEAMRHLLEDIIDFTNEYANRSPDIIIGGDFNMTFTKIKELSEEGDPLM
jgi:hypothetical protein